MRACIKVLVVSVGLAAAARRLAVFLLDGMQEEDKAKQGDGSGTYRTDEAYGVRLRGP